MSDTLWAALVDFELLRPRRAAASQPRQRRGGRAADAASNHRRSDYLSHSIASLGPHRRCFVGSALNRSIRLAVLERGGLRGQG